MPRPPAWPPTSSVVTLEIAATSIGARAARLLAGHDDWRIAAVSERSFYLRSGLAFVCVGEASIGNGPLNALFPKSIWTCLSGTLPPPAFPGEPARGRKGSMAASSVRDPGSRPGGIVPRPTRRDPGSRAEPQVLSAAPAGPARPGAQAEGECHAAIFVSDNISLHWSAATLWTPRPWPVASADAFIGNRLRALTAAATGSAPPQSFAHALSAHQPVGPLDRKARAGIANLRAALHDSTSGTIDAAVTSLAGLGHGLTPSGDDVLAGCLLMLHALGQAERANALADAVRRIAPARTSPLSYALLEPACDGEAHERVAAAIVAFAAGRPAAEVIRPLGLVGATSGYDMLAGMLIAAGR